MALVSCSVDGGPDRASDGPLSGHSGSGSTIAAKMPGKSKWSVTFGAFLLCSTHPGTEIEIDRVRYDVTPEPVALTPMFRHIPPASEIPPGPHRADLDPIFSQRGKPPFRASRRIAGTVSSTLDKPITQSCDDLGPTHAMTELLTVMTVDEKGGLIRHTYVDYHVGGEDYTLTLDWVNGMCGTALTHEDGCPG